MDARTCFSQFMHQIQMWQSHGVGGYIVITGEMMILIHDTTSVSGTNALMTDHNTKCYFCDHFCDPWDSNYGEGKSSRTLSYHNTVWKVQYESW